MWAINTAICATCDRTGSDIRVRNLSKIRQGLDRIGSYDLQSAAGHDRREGDFDPKTRDLVSRLGHPDDSLHWLALGKRRCDKDQSTSGERGLADVPAAHASLLYTEEWMNILLVPLSRVPTAATGD